MVRCDRVECSGVMHNAAGELFKPFSRLLVGLRLRFVLLLCLSYGILNILYGGGSSNGYWSFANVT